MLLTIKSKIGSLPIDISDIKVEIKENTILLTKGDCFNSITLPFLPCFEISIQDNLMFLTYKKDLNVDIKTRISSVNQLTGLNLNFNNIKLGSRFKNFIQSLYGTYRILINNMCLGLKQPFIKELEFSGVSFNVLNLDQVQKKLEVDVGCSITKIWNLKSDLTYTSLNKKHLKISGIDKQKVHQECSAIIRQLVTKQNKFHKIGIYDLSKEFKPRSIKK